MIDVVWDGRVITVSGHPDPPYVEGRHAFTAAVVFDIHDPARLPILLDAENARAVVNVFCWWCKAATDNGEPCPGRSG